MKRSLGKEKNWNERLHYKCSHQNVLVRSHSLGSTVHSNFGSIKHMTTKVYYRTSQHDQLKIRITKDWRRICILNTTGLNLLTLIVTNDYGYKHL